jgi:hypothetical protein
MLNTSLINNKIHYKYNSFPGKYFSHWQNIVEYIRIHLVKSLVILMKFKHRQKEQESEGYKRSRDIRPPNYGARSNYTMG